MEKSRSQYKINKSGKLSSIVTESSGLAPVKGRRSFWTHNDSGGGGQLFEIDSAGRVLSVRDIPGARNVDWEDLASDRDGTVYIGDIGNNSQTRRDLGIYKVPETGPVAHIRFSYADQAEFPPPAHAAKFDSEAFFYFDGGLFLFSKNGIKTDHFVKLYRLPSAAGDYRVYPSDSVRIRAQVTGADVSPDGRTFALLTYGKILLFGIGPGPVDFSRPLACIRLFRKQTEAILFLDNNNLMVTNEQRGVYHITKRRH